MRQIARNAKRNHFDIEGPDMIVFSSTINNAICSRNLMIPEFVSLIDKSDDDTDFLEIARLTIGRVRDATGDSQIPEIRSTMEYKLRLKQIFKDKEYYKSRIKRDIKSFIGNRIKASAAFGFAQTAASLFRHVGQRAIEHVADKMIERIEKL